MEIRLTKKQQELLEMGDKYIGPNGQQWYYIPQWFKKENGRLGAFKVYTLDELPEDVKKGIRDCKFYAIEKKDGETK